MHNNHNALRPLPIKKGNARIGSGSQFIDCPPIIEVHVSAEPNWSAQSGKPPAHNGILYSALIDTGAEGIAISIELAKAIGAVSSSKALLHGFGGTQELNGANIHIFIPMQNIVHSTRAVISDLKSAGHTFTLILGRSFLEHCRLVVDGPSGLYKLLWVG